MSFLFGNPSALATSKNSCTKRWNKGRQCRQYIVQRGRRCGSPVRRRRCGTAADGQCRTESSHVKWQKDALSAKDISRQSRRSSESSARSSLGSTRQEYAICREMLINDGVRIADLFRDLAKRHSFIAAIGKHFAGSRKDFAPRFSLRSSRRLGDVDVTSS